MLEARRVELHYGTHVALIDVDLEVPARGVTAIHGQSGCGKSSLLYVLSGLRPPTAGEIWLDSIPLKRLSTARLRSERFSFVFQDHFLVMHLNAFENVIGAMRHVDPASIQRALDLLTRLGLDGVRHKVAWRLSGGERQRVAVARALVRPSEYVFADEPTAALDRSSAADVYELLREAATTRAVVLVTHDPKGLEIADAVVELRDGRRVRPRDRRAARLNVTSA